VRILLLLAHPALERSRVHRALLARIAPVDGLTVHDLYEAYPGFDIDVPREQALLAENDLLVVQHPFFWYSTPALVKQWEDLVLEHGWAYGLGGTALRGKFWLHAISAGGREAAYQREGHNRYTMRELLAPLEQTARLCGMTWVPPYVIHGTHRLDEAEIERAAVDYWTLLQRLLADEIDLSRMLDAPTLNAALAGTSACSDRVELLRRLGMTVYYGDATRHDLLHTAGGSKARLLVIALDTPEKTLEVVHTAWRHFPDLEILARAFDWQDAHDLLAAGVTHVYREAPDTSLRLGTDALRLLGFRAYQAHRAAQRFLRHDEQALRDLTPERGDAAAYISLARRRIEELEQMLKADLSAPPLDRDAGWDAESLREEARARASTGAPGSSA
jgi:glutathione-regulated potassium-efflux system ancillary protein KefG